MFTARPIAAHLPQEKLVSAVAGRLGAKLLSFDRRALGLDTHHAAGGSADEPPGLEDGAFDALAVPPSMCRLAVAC